MKDQGRGPATYVVPWAPHLLNWALSIAVVIPANPTDSHGRLPLFYSSQRIPILLVRHTAFGNCYWKKINSCVFSVLRSFLTAKIILHAAASTFYKMQGLKMQEIAPFCFIFLKISRGGMPPDPPRDACDCVARQPTAFPSKKVGRYASCLIEQECILNRGANGLQ